MAGDGSAGLVIRHSVTIPRVHVPLPLPPLASPPSPPPPPLPIMEVPGRVLAPSSHNLEVGALTTHEAGAPEVASEAAEAGGENDANLASSELSYRKCCEDAWRSRLRVRETEFCEGAASDMSAPSSRLTCVDGPQSDGSAVPAIWYCTARGLIVNSSAISVGSDDLSVPTTAQKGLWRKVHELGTGHMDVPQACLPVHIGCQRCQEGGWSILVLRSVRCSCIARCGGASWSGQSALACSSSTCSLRPWCVGHRDSGVGIGRDGICTWVKSSSAAPDWMPAQ
mgnify:CR=1 FL=1